MYYPTNENVRASLSLRRDPRLGEHILPIILHRAVIICTHLLPPVKAVPHLVPVPPRRGLAVFRCAGFEEFGVLNTVQQRRGPQIGSSSGRGRGCQYGWILVGAGA